MASTACWAPGASPIGRALRHTRRAGADCLGDVSAGGRSASPPCACRGGPWFLAMTSSGTPLWRGGLGVAQDVKRGGWLDARPRAVRAHRPRLLACFPPRATGAAKHQLAASASAECCEKNSAPSSVSTMWRGLLDLLRGTATVSASPELRTSKASVCSASTCATASR